MSVRRPFLLSLDKIARLLVSLPSLRLLLEWRNAEAAKAADMLGGILSLARFYVVTLCHAYVQITTREM